MSGVNLPLKEIKTEWNKGLDRIKKAEEVAVSNPELFEQYIDEFNNICRRMSYLMEEYKLITGQNIPEEKLNSRFE